MRPVASNPYHAALRQAQRDTRFLRQLFDNFIGNEDHPRGRVLTAYRKARRQIQSIVTAQPRNAEMQVRDVLFTLERDLRDVGQTAIDWAASRGQESAQKQVEAYNEDGAVVAIAAETAATDDLVRGWMAEYQKQEAAALAMMAMGEDPIRIVGDATRMGILQPAPVAAAGASWFAQALGVGMANWLIGRDRKARQGFTYSKQAIAAIDERTTDCCLRVHGQVVPFDGKFKLTGTPRFADEMEWSPFHWYCRTSVAMYHESFEEGETEQMREAARAELEARAGAQAHVDEIKRRLADMGQQQDIRVRQDDTDEVKRLREQLRMWKERVRVEIHPAHATSKRGEGDWRWGP